MRITLEVEQFPVMTGLKICHVDGELKFIGDGSHLDQGLCKLMAVAI